MITPKDLANLPHAKVLEITQSDSARLLSQYLPGNKAVMSIHYPTEDAGNLKSRLKLVSELTSHGFAQVADQVVKGSTTLLFTDHTKARKVLAEINKDSFAIGASLYIAGKPVGHE